MVSKISQTGKKTKIPHVFTNNWNLKNKISGQTNQIDKYRKQTGDR